MTSEKESSYLGKVVYPSVDANTTVILPCGDEGVTIYVYITGPMNIPNDQKTVMRKCVYSREMGRVEWKDMNNGGECKSRVSIHTIPSEHTIGITTHTSCNVIHIC